MGALKDIGGLVRSKATQFKTRRRLVSNLNNKIGPESVVGMKNIATNYKKINKLVKSGNQEEAVAYAKSQKEKVGMQMQEEYQKRLDKTPDHFYSSAYRKK